MEGNIYIEVKRRRKRGMIGIYEVVGIFVMIYEWLFKGIMRVRGF